MLLLDSDVLIDIQRGYPAAVDWFSGLIEMPAVPGMVVMELIQDARNLQEVRRALKLVSPLPIVWPTEADCSRALSDFTAFRLSHNLGFHALSAGLRRFAPSTSSTTRSCPG